MSELKKIRDLMDKKFQELKEELQSGCEHEKISDWMEVHWAIGHTTGTMVKNCERCGIQMEKTSGFIEFVHDKSEPSGLKRKVSFTDNLGVTVIATDDSKDDESG